MIQRNHLKHSNNQKVRNKNKVKLQIRKNQPRMQKQKYHKIQDIGLHIVELKI